MGEIGLVRSWGEGHESSIRSQWSACNVGSLFLVLLLPSSILVSPTTLSTGRACPMQWARNGCPTRYIFPWKIMHWDCGGEISLLWALELSLWTKLRPEPTWWCFYQPAVVSSGPASQPPHLCSLEQKSPTDIISLNKMTKVETVFPNPSNQLLSLSPSKLVSLSVTGFLFVYENKH